MLTFCGRRAEASTLRAATARASASRCQSSAHETGSSLELQRYVRGHGLPLLRSRQVHSALLQPQAQRPDHLLQRLDLPHTQAVQVAKKVPELQVRTRDFGFACTEGAPDGAGVISRDTRPGARVASASLCRPLCSAAGSAAAATAIGRLIGFHCGCAVPPAKRSSLAHDEGAGKRESAQSYQNLTSFLLGSPTLPRENSLSPSCSPP